MKPSLRSMLVCVLSATALAACGSSSTVTVPTASGGPHTPQSSSPDSLAAWRAVVACARHHGMPSIPDPVLDTNGQAHMPGGAPTLSPQARSACATQIQATGGSTSDNPIESSPDIQALLRVAACFRRHGFPRWPDPNNRGEFHVRSADAGTQASEGRASAACSSLFPPSGWHLIVTPTGQ